MDLEKKFRAYLRTSSPTIIVQTADQQAMVQTLYGYLKKKKKKSDDDDEGNGQKRPVIEWDLLRGAVGLNEEGAAAIIDMLSKNAGPEGPPTQAQTTNPVEFLTYAQDLPAMTVTFLYNSHFMLGDGQRPVSDGMLGFSQAISNLRTPFKNTGRMLVLLVPPSFANVPVELAPDLPIFDEPSPDQEQLETIVRGGFKNWNATNKIQLDDPDPGLLVRSVDALRGIESQYAAEQVVSIAIGKRGLNLDECWERKRQMVNNIPGLKVYRGGDTFADVAGYPIIKEDFTQVMAGRRPIRTIVFIDEIEKMFQGAGTDSSGTTTEMLGMILTEMEDTGATGYIFLGPPGSGKSQMSKAFGGEARVPLIYQDIAGAKGMYVGQSTANLRRQFKCIRSVSDQAALFVATCNSISALPPELRRRFKLGIWYFDLPTREERDAIWRLYFKKYDLPEQPLPDDTDWTGAEIRECCDRAWNRNLAVVESAKRVIPVAVSAKDRLEKLRMECSGKYLSASTVGVYRYTNIPKKKDASDTAGRLITSD